jgi:hypothetical protein
METIKHNGKTYEIDIQEALSFGVMKVKDPVKVGDKFRLNDGFYQNQTYMICMVAKNTVMLIGMNGNRWSDNQIKVNDIHNISPEELDEIFGSYSFVLRKFHNFQDFPCNSSNLK